MISRKWDASSPAERAEILRRDESMRSPDWAPLVLKMSPAAGRTSPTPNASPSRT